MSNQGPAGNPAQPQRNGTGQAQQQRVAPAPQSTVHWAQQNIAGMFSDAGLAAEKLRLASTRCHLIGGASVCPLKVGHEIMVSVIAIDPDTTFPQKAPNVKEGEKPPPEKRGIGGPTIMQIAAAAGVEWTGAPGLGIFRLDDQRDPRFVKMRAVGRYPAIDGSWRPLVDEADNDYREGSDQLATLKPGEIPYKRAKIVRLTITGAQLRAIRKVFGIPHSMTLAELDKPYVFARLIYTGRDKDPQIARMFAAVEAQKQLMATAALYGLPSGVAPSVSQLPHAPAIAQLGAGFVPAFDEDHESEAQCGTSAPAAATVVTAGAAAPDLPPPAAAGAPAAGGRPRVSGSDLFLPGKDKIKIRAAEDKDLKYWAGRIEKDFAEDKVAAQYVATNKEKLAAIKAEIELRARGGEVPAAEPSDEDARRAAEIDRGEPQGRQSGDDGY